MAFWGHVVGLKGALSKCKAWELAQQFPGRDGGYGH